MSFSERAVDACAKAMRGGRVSERHVINVLRYDDADVTSLAVFLSHPEEMIRRMCIRIFGERRLYKYLISCLTDDHPFRMTEAEIMEIMTYLGKSSGKDIDVLIHWLKSENMIIREDAIDMFHNASRDDCLLPLVFTKDDECLVARIKDFLKNDK